MPANTTVTWTVCHPKKSKLKPEQKAYIQQFVDSMELSFQGLDSSNPSVSYEQWIDVPSFVDYFIHTELSLNADGFKRSAYFFKDKDLADGTVSKMQAGPVWDYNLAYGNCNFCNANNVEAWVCDGCGTNPTPEFWKILSTDRSAKGMRSSVSRSSHSVPLMPSSTPMPPCSTRRRTAIFKNTQTSFLTAKASRDGCFRVWEAMPILWRSSPLIK